MRSAFSSTRQAIAFSLLLATFMLLPAVAALTGWFKIEGRYPFISCNYGSLPTLEQEIFVNTNTVDVAFLGSSRVWGDIDTPYVAQAFSQRLQREAEVFTLGWRWSGGYDALYFIARDLLDHRCVKMLVVCDETGYAGSDERGWTLLKHSPPHRLATFWYWRAQDVSALGLVELPLKDIIARYGAAIIDIPRYLLDWIRPNLPFDPEQQPYMQQVAADRGALLRAYGFSGEMRATSSEGDPRPFPPTPADVVVYAPATREAFTFTGPAWDAYARHFAGKLARLCQERGTKVVVLHFPTSVDTEQRTISEPRCWPEDLGAPVELAGIPGAKLFAGLAPEEVRKLFFYDRLHLNQQGADLFTRLITPTLLKFYDASTNHF